MFSLKNYIKTILIEENIHSISHFLRIKYIFIYDLFSCAILYV